MNRLKNKVCLITGGARGMGAADAALFATEGARVVLTDVLIEEGRATAAAVGGTFIPHDVTDPLQWAAVVEHVVTQHGRLDVLVNNAGVGVWGSLLETTLDDWERVVAINQTGVFLGMQAAARPMIERRCGSIINMSSIAGLQGVRVFAYGATKWAVRGMTKSAALELGPLGIRVNSVHPGVIDTPMIDGLDLAEAAQRVPLRRTGTVDEVAQLVLWLASDESGYANGAEFVLDGGATAGREQAARPM